MHIAQRKVHRLHFDIVCIWTVFSGNIFSLSPILSLSVCNFAAFVLHWYQSSARRILMCRATIGENKRELARKYIASNTYTIHAILYELHIYAMRNVYTSCVYVCVCVYMLLILTLTIHVVYKWQWVQCSLFTHLLLLLLFLWRYFFLFQFVFGSDECVCVCFVYSFSSLGMHRIWICGRALFVWVCVCRNIE